MTIYFWRVVAVLTLLSSSVFGANILMVTITGSKSHTLPFLTLAPALIEKGHNVTFISPIPTDKVTPGLVNVNPPTLVKYVHDFNDRDLFGPRMRNEGLMYPWEVIKYLERTCSSFLSDPVTDKFLRDPHHFDLVILESYFPACSLALVHHYKTEYMFINAAGGTTDSFSYAGNPSPYSVTPIELFQFTDKMTFSERIFNSCFWFVYWLHKPIVDFYIEPLVRTRWPDAPDLLNMMKEASFILQNGHPAVTFPRPFLPNVVEIGCMHCRPAKPLPSDLEEFVNGSSEGFIYVSMGGMLREDRMPEELRRIFRDVFAQLPYRVVWKWNSSSDENPTSNVLQHGWLPQQDILGHRNIRAFVSHCGLNSIYEAVYHGVPVVALPVYQDQVGNAFNAETAGYAVNVDLSVITTHQLLSAIQTVATVPSYRQAVQNRSTLFRDQPESPLTRAVYWTEYVLRHRGAPHLRSPARHMSVVEYYLLDIAALALLLGAIVKTTVGVLKRRTKLKQS